MNPAVRSRGERRGLHPTMGASLPIRLADRAEFAVFRSAIGLFAALPRALALRAGARLGMLFYHLDWRDRAVAVRNLALAFPEKSEAERDAILRAACRNLGRLAAEACHLPRLTAESASRLVRVEEPARWEDTRATARTRGTVILTAHFGNFELLAYACGLFGQPVTLVHRPMRNPLVDEAILRLRTGAGTRSLPKKAAAKEALRALHRKEMVAIPADQNQTRAFGVFVDFFGRPACTTPGPARLAMLTGAPIVPVFLVREGETERHRLVILPEVEVVRSGDREADIVATTQRCTAVIEQMLRVYPEQWIWFHKRWKTRPEGEPKCY